MTTTLDRKKTEFMDAEPSGDGERRALSYVRVIRHIRRAIRAGELIPGQQLRLRETLRQDFDMGNSAMQRAFTQLAEDGFIVTRGRSGTFVSERPPNLYRIGLGFYSSKGASLADKSCLSLATAAATAYDEHAERTVVPYYNVSNENGPGDLPRLLADLEADRLAGMIWFGVPNMLAPQLRAAAERVPNVYLGVFSRMKLGREAEEIAGLSLVDVAGFIPRAAAEMARMGGRRVAVLMLAQCLFMAEGFEVALWTEGMSTRRIWMHGVMREEPRWADTLVQTLFSLPEDKRPDSLIVADDHLNEQAIAGVASMGLLGKIKLLCHANFPVLSPLPTPVRQVGFANREILKAAVDLIDRLRTHPAEAPVRVKLSPRTDLEFAAAYGKASVSPAAAGVAHLWA